MKSSFVSLITTLAGLVTLVRGQEYDVIAYSGSACMGADLGGVSGNGGTSACHAAINSESLLIETLGTGCSVLTFPSDPNCIDGVNNIFDGGEATGCQKNLDFSYFQVEC